MEKNTVKPANKENAKDLIFSISGRFILMQVTLAWIIGTPYRSECNIFSSKYRITLWKVLLNKGFCLLKRIVWKNSAVFSVTERLYIKLISGFKELKRRRIAV